jgi:hypothetical protein
MTELPRVGVIVVECLHLTLHISHESFHFGFVDVGEGIIFTFFLSSANDSKVLDAFLQNELRIVRANRNDLSIRETASQELVQRVVL